MKIASPQITHKSDAGGVRVNIAGDSDARQAFRDIVKNAKNTTKKQRYSGCS